MSTSDTINGFLTANEQLAQYQTVGRSQTVEGQLEFQRGDGYGAMYVHSLMGTRVPMTAREGSYWVATNTPGTPITSTNVAAFGATTPALTLFNGNTVASNKYIYPVRMKVVCTAAGTSSTNWINQWLIDSGNRYSSGGSTLTPVSPNMNVASASTNATVKFGALTATAATASRIVGAHQVRTVISVVGDQYEYEFGGSTPGMAGMPLEGTLQLNTLIKLPAIALPPQCTLLWYEYGASQAAAKTFDYIQLEYVER